MDNLLNKIHFADCLDILRQLPDESVDLLLQDPPYNTTNCEWETSIDFAVMWQEWERVAKNDSAMVFTASQPFTTDLIFSGRRLFRYDLIWEKFTAVGFLDAKKRPMRNHEHILIFGKKRPRYTPQMRKASVLRTGSRKPANTQIYGKQQLPGPTTFDNWTEKGERYPVSVLKFDVDGERYASNISSKNLHPTKKPVDLFRYLIRTYSNPGDVVFDGYGGSGTTAIAAQMENRKFIVCENHLPYFEASQARLANLVAAPYLFSDFG
jgi:site-specific DNA-methyltransferase (adenine-specific)